MAGYFGGFLLVRKTFSGFPALRVQNCFFGLKAFYQKKQICTPTAGNPGNVLLTSRNPPKYFYQCKIVYN